MRFFFVDGGASLFLCLLWSMFSAVFREKKNTSEIRREDAQRKKKQWNLGRDPFFPIFPHFKFPVFGVPCCRSLPWRLPITYFFSIFSHFPHFSSFFPILGCSWRPLWVWLAVQGQQKQQQSSKNSNTAAKAAKTAARKQQQQHRNKSSSSGLDPFGKSNLRVITPQRGKKE